MALLTILTYPDPRLREVSSPVEVFDQQLATLVSDMLETMKKADGIGLAAPQVGVLKRILVIDILRPEEPDDEPQELSALEKKISYPLVLINPQIIKGEGQTVYEEGCLSVPGYYEEVNRFQWVQVEAKDVKGQSFRFETDGLLAICIQHEMDHLEGKLFIDRLSFVKSNKIKNKIKKLGYPKKKESTEKEGAEVKSNAKAQQTSREEGKKEGKVGVAAPTSPKNRTKVEV